MKYRDPLPELLSSLEQIVFKDAPPPVLTGQRNSAFTEFESLRSNSGLKPDEFARAMGVSVALVQEWESRREKPSVAELSLMRLIQTQSASSKY